MVAPSNGAFHGRRVLDGIETVRFGYFWPRSLERLTKGGGGILENMAESLLARLQVLPMMLAFVIVTLREICNAEAVYANWLGAGIVGAVVNFLTRTPLVVSFRGDDGYLARDRWVWRIADSLGDRPGQHGHAGERGTDEHRAAAWRAGNQVSSSALRRGHGHVPPAHTQQRNLGRNPSSCLWAASSDGRGFKTFLMPSMILPCAK